jgi:hypothetical protein
MAEQAPGKKDVPLGRMERDRNGFRLATSLLTGSRIQQTSGFYHAFSKDSSMLLEPLLR